MRALPASSDSADYGLQPNPAAGRVLAVIRGEAAAPEAVVARNGQGQTFRLPFTRITSNSEELTLALDLTTLAAGMYVVSFQWPGYPLAKRLIVR